MDTNHGIKCRIPQAPWVLFFDGASRKPGEHAALGFVLLNSKGQVVEEGRRYLGGGISSELAKYKALLAGLKKAKSLKVKHLLVKGNSPLLVNQVVGRCAVEEAYLRDHLKKAWVISREFESMFMEFIPKDQNFHADRIANAAIDKELQIQQAVNEYFDRSDAWPLTSNKSAPASPVPVRALTPFSNPKLQSVSPQHQNQNVNINNFTTGSKPLLKSLPSRSGKVEFHGSTKKESRASNSELLTSRTTKIKSGKFRDSSWHEDLDKLSISDESSITESEEESYFKQLTAASSLHEVSANLTAATSVIVMASDDDTDVDSSENEEELFSRSDHRMGIAPSSNKPVINVINADLASSAPDSGIKLSEADYDRLVTAVISRMKKKVLN